MNVYWEIIGYLGTALIVASMLMTSVAKLRIVNICGSACSMVYAILCRTWPVVLLNFTLILINVIQLIRMRRESRRTAISSLDT